MIGVVLGSSGGVYRVRLDDGAEVDAFLRGRLKREARTGDRVVAGDRVRVSAAGGEEWTIEEVEERRSELVRAGPGGRNPKVVAANADQVVVVLAAADPPFRPEAADRFLVLAESCDLEPMLVVNKMDLEVPPGLESALAVLREVGYRILETSVPTGAGLEALREAMRDRTSVIVGPSGVGKSSLLNVLAPGLRLRTGEVSRRVGRGRHTTVGARLLELPGVGRVVDTPGFSDVATWGVSEAGIGRAFPELDSLAEGCRFRGCSHLHEPGCAVREAVDEGEVHPGRYESYRALTTRLREGGRGG